MYDEYDERDGGGSSDPAEWNDLSYYEKKTLNNAKMINAMVRPIEKVLKFLRSEERETGLPWWIVLCLASAAVMYGVAMALDFRTSFLLRITTVSIVLWLSAVAGIVHVTFFRRR